MISISIEDEGFLGKVPLKRGREVIGQWKWINGLVSDSWLRT